jgi:hypothetical protein
MALMKSCSFTFEPRLETKQIVRCWPFETHDLLNLDLQLVYIHWLHLSPSNITSYYCAHCAPMQVSMPKTSLDHD